MELECLSSSFLLIDCEVRVVLLGPELVSDEDIEREGGELSGEHAVPHVPVGGDGEEGIDYHPGDVNVADDHDAVLTEES